MASISVNNVKEQETLKQQQREAQEREREGRPQPTDGLRSDYGWIRVKKLINDTKRDMTFTNPNYSKTMTISSGQSESSWCVGNLPYEGKTGGYHVSYYNEAERETKTLQLWDLGHDWMASFVEKGVDNRHMLPYNWITDWHSDIDITFFNWFDNQSHKIQSGYKISRGGGGGKPILALYQDIRDRY